MDKILADGFENSIDSVNEIDQLVYQLHDLTPEEIQTMKAPLSEQRKQV